MRILALDTSTSTCSVALWQDGGVRARRWVAMERGHAEALMPMVRDVLGEAALAVRDVDLFAVTRGPGAFTGLRVGLAAARSLALAVARPCLGVTTLEAVAEGVAADERAGRVLLVALETKRADVYAQAFRVGLAPLGAPAALDVAVLGSLVPVGPLLVAGDATARAVAALALAGRSAAASAAPGRPDAARVAEIAARRFERGAAMAPPRPLYLRPAATSVPRLGKGRVR